MRAFVIVEPRRGEVREVEAPVAGEGEVVVDVTRVGVCGTDLEFYTGEMPYLHTGEAEYPMRIGHEWTGTVASVGAGVDPAWIGRRVVGDTMLGCGVCERCLDGRQHLCADRHEIGIRHGWPGALAAQVRVPAWALFVLPDQLDDTLGALVEPGANAWRAVEAAGLRPGSRMLVLGAGTIGLLAGLMGTALGAEVHLLARGETSARFARSIGFGHVWRPDTLPDGLFDAVLDATNSADMPAFAIERVAPGRRVVWIGLSGEPSLVDSRRLALRDATAAGVLSGSGGQPGAIELYASGRVDPRPLVAGVIGLDDVAGVLASPRGGTRGDAPKVHVDPRR
jgi:threonine dehydrogenase-like Zn-dependent dehydrogenase